MWGCGVVGLWGSTGSNDDAGLWVFGDMASQTLPDSTAVIERTLDCFTGSNEELALGSWASLKCARLNGGTATAKKCEV